MAWGSIGLVLAGLMGLSGALTLTGGSKPAFNRHQKAYYLSQGLIDFVRPGILFKITQARIAQDGTISATFQISDPQGLPLDLNGVNTPGPVKVGMTLATIYNDHVSEEYTSHVTETVTDPKTGNTATQATLDRGARFNSLAQAFIPIPSRPKSRILIPPQHTPSAARLNVTWRSSILEPRASMTSTLGFRTAARSRWSAKL